MAGRTGYTLLSNASAPAFPAQMNSASAWFDPLVGETRATVAALPGAGNWTGRAIYVTADGSVRIWSGSAWLLVIPAKLPNPMEWADGNSIAITAAAWAAVSGSTLTLVLSAACWVEARLGAWMSAGAGDVRAGISITGATTSPPNLPTWGSVAYGYAAVSESQTVSKIVRCNAGTNTFAVHAYRVGSGSVFLNYPVFNVIPLRWA